MSSPTQPRRSRRRNDKGDLVLIRWRDIPAQVNAGTGTNRVQRILPRRFQRAIDRAAMIAGKTQASEYVGEWRRSLVPGTPDDPEAAAMALAAQLEEAFPKERLNEYVKTGGWDPSDSSNPSKPMTTTNVNQTFDEAAHESNEAHEPANEANESHETVDEPALEPAYEKAGSTTNLLGHQKLSRLEPAIETADSTTREATP